MFVAEVILAWKNRLLNLSCLPSVCIGNLLPIDLTCVQVFIVGGWVSAFELVELLLLVLDIVKRLKRLRLLSQPFGFLELSFLGFGCHDNSVVFLGLLFFFLDGLIDFLTLFGFLVWNGLRIFLLGLFIVLVLFFGLPWLGSFSFFLHPFWNIKSPARCLRNQTRR